MELKVQRVGRKARGLLGVLEQAEACCGGGGELRILGNRMQRPSRYKVSVGMGAG